MVIIISQKCRFNLILMFLKEKINITRIRSDHKTTLCADRVPRKCAKVAAHKVVYT